MANAKFTRPLSDERLRPIEIVRSSLEQRHAPDWYELLWRSEWPEAVMVWLLAVAGTGGALLGWTWWEALTPLVVWVMGMHVIPQKLLGRAPYAPVWAMECVQLLVTEKAVLEDFMQSNEGLSRLLSGGASPLSGREFWLLRERAVMQQELRAVVIGRSRAIT